MHAAIDVKPLIPVWDWFRADTDIAPIRDEDGAAAPLFYDSPSQDRRGYLRTRSIGEQFLDLLN